MHGLLQGIEREEAESRLHGGVVLAAPAPMSQQFGQRLQGKLAQPLPLGKKPLLEGFGLDAKAGQQIAPIEQHRVLQHRGAGPGDALLESQGVDLDCRRLQHHGIGFQSEGLGLDSDQGPTEREQSLPQVVPRQIRPEVPPEEAGQLLTRMPLSG